MPRLPLRTHKRSHTKTSEEVLARGKVAFEKEHDAYAEKDVTVIYCDGSCPGNGQKGAVAGYGVFFGDDEVNSKHNVGELLMGLRQTNQEAELFAVYHIFCVLDEQYPVLIKSDSTYARDVVTKWMGNWKKQGWKKPDGTLRPNAAIAQKLLPLWTAKRQANTTFQWVPAHTDPRDITNYAEWYGNYMADQLAKQGAKKRLQQITEEDDEKEWR